METGFHKMKKVTKYGKEILNYVILIDIKKLPRMGSFEKEGGA